MTDSVLPPPGDDDPQGEFDAMFADIVSQFTEPTTSTAAAESVDPREDSGAGERGLTQAEATTGDVPTDTTNDAPTEAKPLAFPVQGWRVHRPPADPADERYLPPPPAPLPAQDATFWTALLGCVGGPLWFLYLILTNPYGSRLAMWSAGLLTITGFALIVFRLPRRTECDPDDDGARI